MVRKEPIFHLLAKLEGHLLLCEICQLWRYLVFYDCQFISAALAYWMKSGNP